MRSSIASNSVTPSARPSRFPPWLLFPIGFALVRLHLDQGTLWWVTGPVLLLVFVLTLYVLIGLADRYPLRPGMPLRHLAPHAIAAVVFVAVNITIHSAISARDPAWTRTESVLHEVWRELLAFLLWSGVAHATVYVRRYRKEEAHALRLRLELAGVARTRAEAELRSFEAELNPSFLIGSLRSAATLADSDPARVERLLAEIGDVVRGARPVARSATLGDEIAALSPFVALEQSRLDQRILLTSNVPDELLDAPMPPMVLAALVREALRAASGSGSIEVDIAAASVAGPREQMQVDVSCRQQSSAAGKARGEDGVLARTVDHLRDAYAGDATIELATGARGIHVRLVVPLEPDASAPEPEPPSEDAAPIPPAPRSGRGVLLVLGAWFIWMSVQNINAGLHHPLSNGLLAPLGLAIIEGLHAAASTTLVLYVAIRLTRRGFGPRVLGLHAIAAVGLGVAISASKTLFVTLAGHPYPPHTFGGFVGRAVGMTMMYAMLAGIVGAFEYARRYRGAEQKKLRLSAELAEAERRRVETELRALKAELNPHFLGNALTGASSLVRTDPAAAREVLTRIADVLGTVVSRVGTQEVTLAEEIEGLASFIAVEQSRFGDRLAVQWEVEEEARGARVPHLILQPLVENAVKHGLATRGGRIVVRGRRSGERLELSVRDNGVGLEQARRTRASRRGGGGRAGGGGLGLTNSRARLEQLYGGAATLTMAPVGPPEDGTIVTVSLPWR